MRAAQSFPVIAEEQVSLHYTAVPGQPWPALEAAWLPRLPAAKREAVLRLRDGRDRNATLLGIALLGSALQAVGVAFDPGAIAFLPRAKPELAGAPEFSIAHAAGLVGCALATGGRVGFDLEARDAVAPAWLRLALDSVEQERVARGELSATTAWVMKEAVLKAAGRELAAVAGVRLAGGIATLDGAAFHLVSVALAPTHVAWLAHERQPLALDVVRREAAEFAPLP